VRALIIYESLTGTTRRAAHLIAERLREAGHEAVVSPVTHVDLQALKQADLVIVGAWTDGIVFFGQRPGRAHRLRRLPVMNGKRAVVYCTYAVDQGHTLEKLAAIVRDRGAEVVGGYAIKRTALEEGVDDFVARVLDALPAPAGGG
jgi:flavorubredoxin